MPDPSPETIASFFARWEKSGGSEKANYALFLTELCDHILHAPHPEPKNRDPPHSHLSQHAPVP